MSIITFDFKGEPVAKERARYNRKTQKPYTPARTKQYEKAIREAYVASGYPKQSGLLAACLMFNEDGFTISTHPLRSDAWRTMPTKDVDNLAKSVLDGLNGVAYDDDKQIASLWVCEYQTPDDLDGDPFVFIGFDDE